MKANLVRSSLSLLVAATAWLFAAIDLQAAQLISAVDPAQASAGGGGDSWLPIISADGRYVLFASTANTGGRSRCKYLRRLTFIGATVLPQPPCSSA